MEPVYYDSEFRLCIEDEDVNPTNLDYISQREKINQLEHKYYINC